MANAYKNIQKTINAAGSDVDMYECPAATTAVFKSIRLFNTHSGTLSVTTKVYDSSSTTDFEFSTNNPTASDSADMLTFNNVLVLEAGDKLKMQCATADKIKMTAAVLQISRS